jgi:lipopolysaccharide export LptBFGC system permease protein LptF
MADAAPAPEYSQPVATRNSTGWTTGARKSTGASGLHWRGISLIVLGAFALVAAGAATQVARAAPAAAVLMLVGVAVCLAGWRVLVVARRREHS